MLVSILITAGPESPAAVSALRYCRALVAESLKPHLIFLYQNGVLLAQNNNCHGPGEYSLAHDWQQFVQNEAIPIAVCTASAIRRGVFDAHTAEQYQQSITLADSFELAGLGTWAEAIRQSHKIISF